MPFDHSAEQALALLDWGVTITHHAVQQAYDPETQTVTESITETELMAIVGPADAEPATGTGGQHRTEQRLFLVGQATWPEMEAGQVRRLVFESDVYDVVSQQRSETAGLLLVTARKLN